MGGVAETDVEEGLDGVRRRDERNVKPFTVRGKRREAMSLRLRGIVGGSLSGLFAVQQAGVRRDRRTKSEE